jgi:Sortilin, neurotensin receptor 3, C-terminal
MRGALYEYGVRSLTCLLRRRKYDLSVKVRARLLTTIPDSTSQKFVLIGSLARKDAKPEGKHVVVFLDFARMRDRQCQDGDFEKWYARGKGGHECIMGHKVRLVHTLGTEPGTDNLVALVAMV